jgi:ketosteroid isomerase-like protein
MINTIASHDRTLVEQYLAAMQAGPGGLEALVGLFDDEAVYVEPFSGQPQVHTGKAEIRAFFENALEQHLNGVRLTLDRLDLDVGRLRSEWTCEIPAFPGPMRGFDLLTLREGRIVRLETTVTEMSASSQAPGRG